MPKIFNLSLHRSGTQSFQLFMRRHGFKAAHWPGREIEALSKVAVDRLDTAAVWATVKELVPAHQVFCDLPYACLYREAFAAYPDARFLIVLRDVSRWTASIRRHIHARCFTDYERLQYWSCLDSRFDALGQYSDEELAAAYLNHLNKVTSFMLENKARFRIFWLNDPALGRHCADYLGFEQMYDFPSVDYLRTASAQRSDRSSTPMPPRSAV